MSWAIPKCAGSRRVASNRRSPSGFARRVASVLGVSMTGLERREHVVDGVEARLGRVADRARERELRLRRGDEERDGRGQALAQEVHLSLDPGGVAAADGTGERLGEAERLDVLRDAAEERAEHLRRVLARDAARDEERLADRGERGSAVRD